MQAYLANITKALLWMSLFLFRMYDTKSIHPSMCTNKPMDNGAGYEPHPTDCDKFIQCQYNHIGVLIGQIQSCAFSTFWNDDKLTCTPARDTDCRSDKCQGHADYLQYKGEGNCRGYWSCLNNKSVAMCCPVGQYDHVNFGCKDTDDTHKCSDLCLDDDVSIAEAEVEPELTEPEIEPEIEPELIKPDIEPELIEPEIEPELIEPEIEPELIELEAPPCDMTPVAGNPYKYRMKATGLITVTMKCPIGTVFSYEYCGCIHDPNIDLSTDSCRRELHLTFDTDANDKSGNNYHVLNENVQIEHGLGIFNGINSRLVIPRFSNMDTIESLFIRIKYFSRHTKTGYTRPLVSNSDCLDVPSILLAEDDINTYFGVGTTESNFIYTHLPQHHTRNSSKMEEKMLVYNFNGGKLTSSDGHSVITEDAPGYIRNTHCALHVGYAESFEPFEGAIDELEVYFCEPKHDKVNTNVPVTAKIV